MSKVNWVINQTAGKDDSGWGERHLFLAQEWVEKDYEVAVFWYLIAAENGHLGAQNNLGTSYAKGQGIDKDFEQAIFWYKRAG